MLHTESFGDKLKSLGYDFFSGVPCSFLKYLINYSINDCEYIGASNEGDAVAIASGAHIGGRKSVVLMQNSGLTNAISPLTSLNNVFRIPILGFVSLRGDKEFGDEPQHELMGQITTELLDLMNIKWLILDSNIEKANKQLMIADDLIQRNESFFFVVKKNTFEPIDLIEEKFHKKNNKILINKKKTIDPESRASSLRVISKHRDDEVLLLATTGKTGRELHDIDDSSNNIYMVGSLGCISSFGLGIALTLKKKKIIIIDGDGSILMRMGNLSTIANYNPSNLLHILLDNHSHDSTGGQSTVSKNIDFISLAASCGYKKSIFIHDSKELDNEIYNWKKNQALTFLHMNIREGSMKNLGRPKLKPFEVKNRILDFLNETIE